VAVDATDPRRPPLLQLFRQALALPVPAAANPTEGTRQRR
jgi:hypothetical protein